MSTCVPPGRHSRAAAPDEWFIKVERRNDMADSVLHKKALGCMLGGTIGDALSTPSEGKEYTDIED